MKRIIVFAWILAVLLSGCGETDKSMEQAMAVRERLQGSGCSFDAEITADYGDRLYMFVMRCAADSQGNLSFTVTEPESIRGITGSITDAGGSLTFDDQVLAFETLADGYISPVSAPWHLLRSLRSGYLRSAGDSETGSKLILDDTYETDSLQVDVWLDHDQNPVAAEFLWQGRRVLSLTVKNFIYG